MPKKSAATPGLPWPRCPKCKANKTVSRDTPETMPPDPVFARCGGCGHEWQVCGALRKGRRCGGSPMDNGRCALDGGKSTGRPLIHGRKSRFLPATLMERVEEGLADKDLSSLMEEIGLVDALMIERYGQLGDDTHAELWGQALFALTELEKHKADGTLAMEPEAGAKFDRLREILNNGQGRSKAEKEIMGLQEQKRKLAETEMKRLHTLNQFVSAKELNALLAVLMSILQESVKDPSERAAVGAKLAGVFRPAIGGRAIGG